MFGIGTGELLLLLVLALLVLGPERMPKLARDVGRTLGDLRKTSDELRAEFLSADKLLEVAARRAEAADTAQPIASSEAARPEAAAPAEAPAQPDVAAEQAPLGEEETAFDREAREARERLQDPERAARAAREGWTIPTDEAGIVHREG
jgi:sec-independent protein translocase protein TatB